MRKLLDWFIQQTTPVKIALTVVVFAVIFTLITTLVNLGSETIKNVEPSKPTPTVLPTPTPEPTETLEPEPTPPPNFDPEHNYEYNVGDLFPHGQESYISLEILAKNASTEQCVINPNETDAQKTSRMAQYIPEVGQYVEDGYFDNPMTSVMERRCQVIGVFLDYYDAKTDVATMRVTNQSFNIDQSEKDKPAAERYILKGYLTYYFTVQHNADGSWTVKGIGK